jgi:uncharacterized protein YndB with AHSA1/START domain
MTLIRKRFHFDVPIEKVFELGTDFKRYPEWNVSYPVTKEVIGDPRAIGTRIEMTMRLLGREIPTTATIIEIDPPSYLKLTGTSAEGGKSTAIYRLTPVGSGADLEFEFEYELPAGFLGHIADKLFVERAIERDLDHSAENFKALVEARQPVLV